MTNPKITITKYDLLEHFEEFPQHLTLNTLEIFIEWFNRSFTPKQKHKIYLTNCYLHYKNYANLNYPSDQVLFIRNFNKLLQMTLREMEMKQGLRSNINSSNLLKGKSDKLNYYIIKRDAKSFFFKNFELH